MSSRPHYPIFCVDCGKPLHTKFAKRCKSCAAKERLRQKPNTRQLAAARAESPNHRRYSTTIDSARLRRAVLEYGASIRQLAELAGCDERTIQRVLAGQRVNFSTVDAIATAISVHVSRFVREEAVA